MSSNFYASSKMHKRKSVQLKYAFDPSKGVDALRFHSDPSPILSHVVPFCFAMSDAVLVAVVIRSELDRLFLLDEKFSLRYRSLERLLFSFDNAICPF